MRREACHNGLARIGQVVRKAGDFVASHPGVDEQGKRHAQALIALARRLVDVIWALLRDKREFTLEPTRALATVAA